MLVRPARMTSPALGRCGATARTAVHAAGGGLVDTGDAGDLVVAATSGDAGDLVEAVAAGVVGDLVGAAASSALVKLAISWVLLPLAVALEFGV